MITHIGNSKKGLKGDFFEVIWLWLWSHRDAVVSRPHAPLTLNTPKFPKFDS